MVSQRQAAANRRVNAWSQGGRVGGRGERRSCVTLRVMFAPRTPPHLRLLAVAASLLALALSACGSDPEPQAALTTAEVRSALDKPASGQSDAARRLEEQAGALLGSGDAAPARLERELAALRGMPAVVNIWAQWCAPCKRELPIFQRVAINRRGQVAFLGVAADRKPKAQELLAEIALPFPSILDPDAEISNAAGVRSLPKTLFFDAQGRRVSIKLGDYPTAEALQADLARYLGVPAR